MTLPTVTASSRRSLPFVLGLGLVATLHLGAFADGENSGNTTPRPIPVPTASGTDSEEGIGSLPSIAAPTPQPGYGGLLPDWLLGPQGLVRPFIVLSGYFEDIGAAVAGADGEGVVTLAGALDTEIDAGFHGDVEVVVDVTEAIDRGVEFALFVGSEFQGGVAAACVDGVCMPPVLLGSRAIELDLGALFDAGVLDGDGVTLEMTSAFGTQASVNLQLDGGSLKITQTLP